MQYPGVAEALRADLDDAAFVRKLAGAEIGRTLDDEALRALGDAVRGELDYRAEADDRRTQFAAAWAGPSRAAVPARDRRAVVERVLTMTRARGKTVVEIAGGWLARGPRGRPRSAIYEFAWGSPLAHGLLNADPNPGNFLVDEQPDGSVHVWCLDFGCAFALPDDVRDADREIWWGLLDDDNASGRRAVPHGARAGGPAAPHRSARDRPRTATGSARSRRRSSRTATSAGHAAYASELAEATGRVLALGGMALPAQACCCCGGSGSARPR